MKLEELKDEEMYVFVAPDGSPQVSTLAGDYQMCVAFAEAIAKKGISKSVTQMFKEGYEVLMVKVNMVQMGDAEAAFNAAKKKIHFK